jgi:hypothetical protein
LERLSSKLIPVIIVPIVGAIIVWMIPTIAGWINNWRQRQNLRRHMKDIIKMHTIHHSLYHMEDSKYSDELEKKRNEIAKILTQGKISELQYTILDKKISDYEDEIRHNKK